MLESRKVWDDSSEDKRNEFLNDKDVCYKELESFGKTYVDLVRKLSNPIDTTNRFINLALHHIDEESQSRQFLLESKSEVRKLITLLKELDEHSKKIETVVHEIEKRNESPSS